MPDRRPDGVVCPYCSGEAAEPDGAGPWLACECGAYFRALPQRAPFHVPPAVSLSSAGVYFIECSGFVKIGSAGNLRSRFCEVRAMCPLPMRLLGFLPTRPGCGESKKREMSLHQRFRHLRQRQEWFSYTPELEQWIIEHTLRPEPFIGRPIVDAKWWKRSRAESA